MLFVLGLVNIRNLDLATLIIAFYFVIILLYERSSIKIFHS